MKRKLSLQSVLAINMSCAYDSACSEHRWVTTASHRCVYVNLLSVYVKDRASEG